MSDEIQLTDKSYTVLNDWALPDAAEALSKGADLAKELQQQIVVRLGDRPIARSLSRLYKARGRDVPPEVQALKGDVYLLTHAIGVRAERGARRVDILGYSATFDGPGSTVDLFPKTTFREFVNANLSFEAGVSADGYAKLPAGIGALMAEVINLGAGAELKLGADAQLVAKLSLAIKTATIQTVGNAASSATWQFHRDETPLVGDQIMVQTVMVPRKQKSLKFSLRAFAVIDPGVFRAPLRIEIAPVQAEVDLTT